MTSRVPRAVIALGLASFLTDFSGEMIYPLLPHFLVGVLGAGAISLGIIEGVAESTAAVLKLVSGIWTDKIGRRKPFVLTGYGIAGFARPLIGLAGSWWVVLVLRFSDRVGKGIRTSPRDALIADVTPEEIRGRAFGIHQSMDHAGAVVGPLVAAALLSWEGVPLRTVFLLAGIPAALVMVVLFFGVREPAKALAIADPAAEEAKPVRAPLSPSFKLFLAAVLLFTLGNSSDAFILLRLSEAGIPLSWVAILWSLHHVVKMVSAYWGGALSDRRGRRGVVISGWVIYAAVYLSFGLFSSTPALIVIFLLYGIYFGLVEPVERAWVADLAGPGQRGTAMGYYHGVCGIAALPASVIFGLIYQWAGPAAAFGYGAVLAVIASLVLFRVPPQTTQEAL